MLYTFALLLLSAPGAGAATFNVNSTADQVDANPGNGVCATSGGQCTLRAAVMEANSLGGSDTINLSTGTYTLSLVGDGEDVAATGDLDINSTITIAGAGQLFTIIDGNLTDRVFDVATLASLTISDATIRRGSLNDTGGAIQFFGALTMTDCTVSDSSAGSKGGGALFTDDSGASLALTRVTISGNDGGDGAGIYMKDIPTASIVDSSVSNNTALGEGGGLFLEQTVVSITNSLISGNDASTGKGGGLRTKGGSCATTLTNVTFSGNVAKEGGAILSDGDQTDLLHVTITNNTGLDKAAGIEKGAGTTTAKSTIIAGNIGGDNCGGNVDSLGYNIDSANTCAFAQTGDQVNTNPLLGPLQDNGGPTLTHELQAGSPAIDASTNSGCPATDQRGESRPADGDGNASSICDIGAFEVTPIVLYALSGTVFEDLNYGGGAGRNRATALSAGGSGRNGARVELYDAGGSFVSATTTAGGGAYTFNVPAGDYTVRAVSASVSSARAGYVAALRSVQTFRTDASSGSAAAVTDHVGGQDPAVVDAGNGSSGSTMNTSTGVFTAGISGTAQSIAPVTVTAANVTAVDFGFNFDTVVNVKSSGQGSLRQFLTNANTLGGDAGLAQAGLTAGIENALFMISNGSSAPGLRAGLDYFSGGSATIQPTSALPDITAPLNLDGATQPGFAGTPVVEVNGTVAPVLPAVGGLVLEANADGSTIRSLVVRDWSGDGIEVRIGSNGNVIAGNYIGRLNTAGTDSGGGTENAGDGVYVAGAGNLIGGATTADRNVISGNGQAGIRIEGEAADGNILLGNRIGMTADGSAELINGTDGITVEGGADNTVIGGAAADAGNWIAPGGGDGIDIGGVSSGTLIRGNRIGTDLAGTANWGAAFAGINIEGGAFDNIIGGTAAGAGNVIAFSGQGGPSNPAGVRVQLAAEAGNEISGNAIYSNVGLGIDLGAAGVTPNDGAKSAGEPNLLMDQPVITGAALSGTNLTVTGYVGSAPGQATFASARVEIFESDNDGSGFGEGRTYLGFLTADASGNVAGSLDVSGLGLTIGEAVSGTATDAAGNTSEFGANFVVTAPSSDLVIAVSDAPDPAPLNGPLIYSILVTNNGPSTASNVVVTDTLPASVNFISTNVSQGSCSGTTTITCTLGAILNGGTASVEIQVTTTATGTITNSASVTADQPDPVPANNSASNDTLVASGSSFDVPLTQQLRLAGFLDYTVTGGSLRVAANATDACSVNASDSASVAGIPASATIQAAYLYWAGSGAATDANVTLDGAPVAADRTFESDFVLGANTYEFFGGVTDVTAAVAAKRNGAYAFSGLAVDTGGIYCGAQAVIAGWSLLVVYEDVSLTGKTLVLYDGFDLTRNGSTSYVLSGIFASGPTEAKTSSLLWEGDETLGGANERLLFNGASLTDGFNPANNVYNGSINTLGSTTEYGLDLDTFDVSAQVSVGDTLATTQVDTGPDLVILNAVVLQVKTNVIVGTVFEDVNYGGGAGRDLATASAAAPSFAVGRPGATVELYDAGGTFLRNTVTDASGAYGFSGLPDGPYQVRVVSDTVTSSRPGATGSERAVQTYRVDASAAVAPITDEVGGTDPSAQDAPANLTSADLATLNAQSVAPATIDLAVTKSGVDFGFNFDTIVNTNDAGQGSLRQFLLNANALDNANLAQDGRPPALDHALFMLADGIARPGMKASYPNLFAGGVATIAPGSALPAITEPIVLDAQTHPAWTSAPIVEINGAGVPAAQSGFAITAGGSTVRGFVMNRFAGSTNHGAITLSGAGGNTVQGNYLGTDAAGSAALPNYQGVRITNSPGNLIGGTTATERNVMSGNTWRGMLIGGAAASGNTVSGNYFGTDAAGTAALAQPIGIYLTDAPNNIIGGTAAGAGNVVSGNTQIGVYFVNAGSTGNLVQGNTIGLDATQTAPIPNGVRGIEFTTGASGNTVGGAAAGAGNVIANNGSDGVRVVSGSGNTLARNSIYSNGGLGIDLGGDAVTLNDSGDGDTGANDLLNFPVITSATVEGPNLTVAGFARPGNSVEVFIAEPNASGFGEGRTWLFTETEGSGADLDAATGSYGPGAVGAQVQGSDTTNRFRFTVPLPGGVGAGTPLTATATDGSGSTSEFGGNYVITQPAIVKRAFKLDGTPVPPGATLPLGVAFRFLLYVNNVGGALSDVSLADALDPAFAYQAGSIRYDNSVAACAALTCTPAEETAIYAAVSAGAVGTDAVDGDVVSYTPTTVHAGNQVAANAQLDLAATRVFALLITVRMQ